MLHGLKPLVIALVLVVGLNAAPAASISKGSPEGRALFEKGQAATKEKKHAEAADFFRRAIDADPDYLEAHESYILARRRAVRTGDDTKSAETIEKDMKALIEELTRLYEGWIRQNPDRAVCHFILGRVAEGASSEKHYRKAVELNPQFGDAWLALATIAEKAGDNAQSLEYAKKAVDSDPDNARALRSYAYKFRESDPARYRSLEMQVVDRWPQTEHGAAALQTLAMSFPDKKDRIPYMERLRASYTPEKWAPSLRGMGNLFNAYMDLDPEKALELARDMAKRVKEEDAKRWQQNAAFAENFIAARNLLEARKFTEAKAALEKIDPPGGIDRMSLSLMKADATAGAGHAAKAYGDLAKLVAETPNERLEKHLRHLGGRLNKTDRNVDDDLWKIRAAAATEAKELNLPQYGEEDRKVNLAAYRGRVVLVNFFFPG